MTYVEDIVQEYKEILTLYIYEEKEDTAIESCYSLSEKVIEIDTSPEEIVTLHMDLLDNMGITEGPVIRKSLNILQEVLVTFGFTYRDYRAMLAKMEIHDQELNVAASLQETMLKTTIPSLEALEIGAISVPAGKVSGDYFNIISHKNNTVSFAVADVIGKGIPAAIAMSMIKFSMDFVGMIDAPHEGLRKLNRVVEKNVNQNMFITMFYGLYNYETDQLCFASAGHEPGLVYRYDLDEFEEIDAEGIVLGVMKEAEYEEKEVDLQENDMIIICTDGVTELRKHDNAFIDINEIKEMIRETRDQHPQDIVQYIYETLIRMQSPNKKDDLTLFILKNKSK